MSRDGVAGLVCLVVSGILLAATRGLPEASSLVPIGPGAYPRFVLGAMALLSLAMIAQDLRSRSRSAPAAPGTGAVHRYGLVVAAFGVFAAYVLLLQGLGFRIATFLFVAGLQLLLDWPRNPRRWGVVLIVALITAWLSHTVFEGQLSVLLPRGRWTDL